jgi:O-antigen/teichoic acid export membrane protein
LSLYKSFFKDTFIYGLASITPRLVSFILVPIHTYILSTASYSVNTNFYVYAAFLNVILTFGLETSFFRYFTAEKEKDKVVSTSTIMLAGGALLFAALAFPFSADIALFFGFDHPVIIQLLVGTVFFDTLVVIPFALLRVEGKSIRFALLRISNVLINLGLNVFLLIIVPRFSEEQWFSYSWLSWLGAREAETADIFTANLIASVITFFMCLKLYRSKISFDTRIFKKLLTYGLPIMVSGIAYTINENLDKLMIARLISPEANGIYAGCYKLGVFMTIYIMAFRMGAEPFFFNQFGKDNAKQSYSFVMTWFVVLACLCMLVVTGFIDFFAGILLRQEAYMEALPIVPVILMANIMLGIYNNLGIWYKLTDKTSTGMYISVGGAALTILVLFGVIPMLGRVGGMDMTALLISVAVSHLVVYSVMAGISYYLGQKAYPVPYETKKIGMYLMSSAGIAILFFYVTREWEFLNLMIILLFGLWIARRENLVALMRDKTPS